MAVGGVQNGFDIAQCAFGLRFDGVTIENPSCVSKTFPNFFEVLETLR